MSKHEYDIPPHDSTMREILEKLLAENENITARAVSRLHPNLKAASSITRSDSRSKLLAEYQKRQTEFRRWSQRVKKISGTNAASALAEKDVRISELEATIQLLTASHLAMLRAVGELGGFSKWAKFYENFSAVREQLHALGALPDALITPLAKTDAKRKRKNS
jgi:hypothetical protein